jgi:hypothetical protein
MVLISGTIIKLSVILGAIRTVEVGIVQEML